MELLLLTILAFVILSLYQSIRANTNSENLDTKLHLQFLFLTAKINNLMATVSQFQDVLSRIDAATNRIAADLQALKAQIQGAGLSAEVEASVLAQLDAAAAKLESVGVSEVPPTESEEPETPEEGGEGEDETPVV